MNRQLFSIICMAGLLLVSASSFAQTDTSGKSTSPLLDKYYPRPKVDTPKAVPVPRSTGVNQQKVTPIITTPQKSVEDRLSFPAPPRPEIAVTPKEAPKKDSVSPQVVQTVVPENPPAQVINTPVAKNEIKTVTPQMQIANDSNKIAVKPTAIAATPTPQKITPSRPEGGFKRPRLGSSSPLYDTYEKNANGAGSVTTLPKK